MVKNRLTSESQNERIMESSAVTYSLYLHSAEEHTGSIGLSFGDLIVLKHLYVQTDEINLSQLRDSVVMLSGASITKITEKLLQKGFIARRENPKSRREKLVKITANGKKAFTKLMKSIRKLNSVVLGGLTSAEKNNFLKMLGKIQANIGK